MFANDLTSIDLVLRMYEEAAAVLQMVNTICVSRTALHGNHRAVGAALDVAFVRLVLLEAMRHNGFALAGSKDVGAQTDNTARGNVELNIYAVAHAQH